MLPRPWIQSPRHQHLVTAVVMAVILAGSLGLAAWVSRANGMAARQHAAPTRRVSLNGLTLAIPANWQQDETASRRTGSMPSPGLAFRDPASPTSILMAIPLIEHQPTSPAEVLTKALVRLTEPEQRRATLGPFMRNLGGLRVAEAISSGGMERGGPIQLHLFAVLTADNQRHWLIYLIDQVEANTDPHATLRENLALLHQIERSAVLEEPP